MAFEAQEIVTTKEHFTTSRRRLWNSDTHTGVHLYPDSHSVLPSV